MKIFSTSLFKKCLVILLSGFMVSAAYAESLSLPTVTPFRSIDFSLKGEDGKQYSLSGLKGKLVIINFWATWCPPCREEMPAMERAWKQLKNSNVVILAINVGETEDQIFEFTANYPVSFPLLMDRKGEVIKKYPVDGLPTSYIINPDGMVTHRIVGTRAWDHPDIITKLRQLAGKK